MLFKLSLSNIRRSLRDYAIYFFTLIIGVSVFYVFNAIGGQAAMLQISESQREIVQLLETLLSGMSVFVAGVLGLLIVYASRFLMKRRSKEFALYMTLGMSKGNISLILLVETLLIGIGSLAVGLLIGIGVSQFMSALVANLFETDMTAYKFTVSGAAIIKTIVYFAVMYLVVMIFNSVVITRMKLITLMQSEKRSEQIKLKNPVVCVIVFLLAAAVLGYAYYQVGWRPAYLSEASTALYIAMGSAATFFIFWSVSGMLLRVLMSAKGLYHSGLNAFTFRQLSSKVNTMVFSMTVICLMLFVTICSLSSAFSIRNSLNSNLKEFCAADCEIMMGEYSNDEDGEMHLRASDMTGLFEENGVQISEIFGEYVRFETSSDPAFTLRDILGIYAAEEEESFGMMLDLDDPQELIGVSDYNALCALYGREPISLESDEYVLLCNYPSQLDIFNMVLAVKPDITVFGKTLHTRYDCCQDGFIDLGAQALNFGTFVVPDDVIAPGNGNIYRVIGNYRAETPEEKAAAEAKLTAAVDTAAASLDDSKILYAQTRSMIYENATGLGAVVTFLGLYIGLVFLIACGAVLSLKELSESVDSVGRYAMLRKIGAEERDLSGSLFVQTGIFFLLPLLLACIHSVVGLRLSAEILKSMGTQQVGASMTATAIIIVLIYGGYFLVTYNCSQGIIRDRK